MDSASFGLPKGFGSVIKSYSHRLLLLPLTVLVIFLTIFGVVEYKKHASDSSIRMIANDPLPVLAQELQVASVALKSAYEYYHPHGVDDVKPPEIMRKALDDLIQKHHAIMAFLSSDPIQGEEHITELDHIRNIGKNIRQIDQNFSIYEYRDPVVWQDSYKYLDALIQQTAELNVRIRQTHDRFIDGLLTQIASDERHRSMLLVFVLVSGFALVLLLLDGVDHYKNTAERARAAEKCNALFAAALQNTRVGVLIRDMRRDGCPVVFLNAAFTQMTGYGFDDVQQGSSEFLFGWKTDPAAITTFRRAVHMHETTILDVLLYRKDGSPFWSEWHLTPILGDNGKVHYFVSLLNDITGLRQTQEDLIQAKSIAEHASAVKSSFLAMMSHEIRTPINGILGVLKLMEDTKLDEEQNHLLGIARTSSHVLHGIINDILDYAKMEAGKIEIVMESLEIKPLVESLIGLGRTLVGEKELEVACEIDPTLPPWLIGDVARLRQILLNLMSNAIKFTEKGSVRVRVFPLLEQEVDGKPGYLLRFEVQDTGMGISYEDQSKLFQEFSQIERSFTRRFGGTGLGLAICRRLITMMQGEINVDSQPGKGSRFWFILPMAVASAPALSAAEGGDDLPRAANLRPLSSLRILLVEDNTTNRLVARRTLERLGLQVMEAVDGQQAVFLARDNSFDLILMDVSMPVMDGMMATHHIRAMDQHNSVVPIIALTAHAMEGDRHLCLSAGMNDYLQKPFSVEDMTRMVERWLNVSLSAPGHDKTMSETAAFAERQTVPPPSPRPADIPLEQAPILRAEQLRSMNAELGTAVLEQVTRVFLGDSKTRVAAMMEVSSVQDLRDHAHTLKSCSGQCGLMRFSRLMEKLEVAATHCDQAQIDALMPLVQGLYDESITALLAERENYVKQA